MIKKIKDLVRFLKLGIKIKTSIEYNTDKTLNIILEVKKPFFRKEKNIKDIVLKQHIVGSTGKITPKLFLQRNQESPRVLTVG